MRAAAIFSGVGGANEEQRDLSQAFRKTGAIAWLPASSTRLSRFIGYDRSDAFGLVAAATASATASAATHWRQRPRIEGRLLTSVADPGEYRDGTPGGLFAVGAIGAGGAHRLKFFELMAASWAVVFVYRHRTAPNDLSVTGNLTQHEVYGQVRGYEMRDCLTLGHRTRSIFYLVLLVFPQSCSKTRMQ